MLKWRYYLLVENPSRDIAEINKVLDSLGEEGWELTTTYMNGAGNIVFIFKKSER